MSSLPGSSRVFADEAGTRLDGQPWVTRVGIVFVREAATEKNAVFCGPNLASVDALRTQANHVAEDDRPHGIMVPITNGEEVMSRLRRGICVYR